MLQAQPGHWGPMQNLSVAPEWHCHSAPAKDMYSFMPAGSDDAFFRSVTLQAMRMYKLPASSFLGAAADAAPSSHLPAHSVSEVLALEAPTSPSSVPQRCSSPTIMRQHDGKRRQADSDPSSKASVLPLAVISAACLHALLGSRAVIARLQQGDLCLRTVRPLALQKLLQPICSAGTLRARVEAFVQQHSCASPGITIDATLQAFAHAVGSVLDHHTSTMRQIVASISNRRDAAAEDATDMPLTEAATIPTPLEILQHTKLLRRQLALLAHLCWCYSPAHSSLLGWQQQAFPKGDSLLDHLYKGACLSICVPLPTEASLSATLQSSTHCRSRICHTSFMSTPCTTCSTLAPAPALLQLSSFLAVQGYDRQ